MPVGRQPDRRVPPDPDNDGYGANDCAPSDPAIHPGAPDPIDQGYVDSDCDGTDGTLATAILVAPTGADAPACGTVAAPCGSIVYAVARAAGTGTVYAQGGTYIGRVEIPGEHGDRRRVRRRVRAEHRLPPAT